MSISFARKLTQAPHSPGGKKDPPSFPTGRLINKESLTKLTDVLDPKSSEVIWYLWHNKHARIDELAKLSGTSTHMMTLYRIRKHINPTAQKILGKPILVFKKIEADPLSGEIIPFSWWLAVELPEPGLEELSKEPLIDIFDEEDHVNIVVELLGVEEEAIQIGVEEHLLTISVDNPDGQLLKTISLPPEVDTRRLYKAYNNGVLKIKLMKMKKAMYQRRERHD